MNDIKARVRVVFDEIKQKNRWTNEQLSEKLGYRSKNYVSDILSGKDIPDLFLGRVEKTFGVSKEWLKTGVQDESLGTEEQPPPLSTIEGEEAIPEKELPMRTIYNLSQCNIMLSEGHLRIIALLESKFGGSDLEKTTAEDARLSDLLELIAEVGTGKTKWHSMQEASAELNRRFYGKKQGASSVGNYGH